MRNTEIKAPNFFRESLAAPTNAVSLQYIEKRSSALPFSLLWIR